jgi:predicted  nucleic acid-binding Zn-ribbon protein
MFENNIFDEWLDAKSKELVTAMGSGKPLLLEDMMVLVLKAQTNHFSHLDIELRKDMKDLREDMKDLREDMDVRFEQVDKRFEENRKEMDRRFEENRKEMDKRFEQVDKRFEQVDRRFDTMISRMDRLMIWSFATTLSAAGMVVAAVKWL